MGKGNPNIAELGKPHQFQKGNKKGKGRGPSLRNELRKLLDKQGKITFDQKDIVKTYEDGSVEIKVPEREALMLRLVQIAKGRTSNNIRAIQMIMEHLEGKPTQLFEFMEYENVPTIFVDATDHLTDEEE